MAKAKTKTKTKQRTKNKQTKRARHKAESIKHTHKKIKIIFFGQTCMSSVINFSALINQETNENRFNMKDMKLPVTCHQKKDMNHFIYLNSEISE